MTIWQPSREPFRVISHVRNPNRLQFGWISGVNETFATLQEARKFAASVASGNVFAVYVHEAKNAATWAKNGRWHLIAKIIPGARET